MHGQRHHQIGEVAERLGLSLRTIRYYEEVGLVTPSGRTDGGFRLYTEEDIALLETVKALKPIGMSLEAMQELLDAARRGAAAGGPAGVEARFAELLDLAHRACLDLERRAEEARRVLAGLELEFRGAGSAAR